MPHAAVAGHDLFYDRTGDPGGEPLLLIMGMSGSRLSWGEAFLGELARDFDVVAYDHRGVGSSSRSERPFTLAELAEDAAGLLDALGWDTAHVVGISMGGMVAQELALAHPERLRTLTLGCTYAGGEGSSLTAPETFQALSEGMLSGDRERALRVGWEVNVSEAFATHDEQFAAFRSRALEAPVAVPIIMAQLQAINGHDTSARLGQISTPTLVVHGTEDRMLPAFNAKLIADAIPGARLELLEGVGHLYFWEQPERSAELVRELAAKV